MDQQFEAAQAKQFESRETKEAEVSEEVKAAAAMERADYLVKEVKSSKQQMQNIVRHVQEVKQAITQIRTQLQLAQTDDASSLAGDAEQIEKLKKKIAEYSHELHAMRDDLVHEQMEILMQDNTVSLDPVVVKKQAEQLVDSLIGIIK